MSARASAEPLGMLHHATCVAIAGRGVLLLGRPGSGKSDLALRLIDRPGRGPGRRALAARLVADDQVELAVRGGRLFASAPAAIAGLIEVRGLGILRVARLERAEVALAVRLVAPDAVERLPAEAGETLELQGVVVPLVRLAPFEGSAEAKVRAALWGRLGDADAAAGESRHLPAPAAVARQRACRQDGAPAGRESAAGRRRKGVA